MIKFGKIILVPLEETNLELIWKWRNDPEVAATLVNVHESREIIKKWYETVKFNQSERNFLIIDSASGKSIGHTGLAKIDFVNRNAELFVIIGEKNYWNQAFGRDTVNALLRYGFHELNLQRIYLDTVQYNEKAIKCYQACGFVEEGLLRKARYKNGAYHDVIIMGILRDEWENKFKTRV